jgi:hypothetical protein
MSRLVASGCSCTQHCWPTWADYLGRHFDEYVNVAIGGADNAVIARNAMSVARPGDTVVIQWTGFDRFNTFSDDAIQMTARSGDTCIIEQSGMTRDNLQGGWQHTGTVRSPTPEQNKIFLLELYHRVERFRHTLDYVKMVEMHSQLNGYTVWNFSMMDWFQAEIEKDIDPRLVRMHYQMSFRHFYLRDNLINVRNKLGYLSMSHKYAKTDDHPTPWANWIWLKDHVAPEIGIDVDLSLEDQVKFDQNRVLKGEVD